MTVQPAGEKTTRSSRRGTVRRIVATALVLGATAAVAVVGSDVAAQDEAIAAPGTAVALGARSTTLVCPGPVALSDPGSTNDEGFSSTPVETRTSLRTTVVGDGLSAALVPFTGTDEDDATPVQTVDGATPSAQSSIDDLDDALVLRTSAGDGGSGGTESGLVAASVASATSAGDLQGVAAAGCQAPGISQWLVGGSTELGTSTRLVLQNPSRTPATVTITVWGAGGELDLAGPATYLVPPSSQVSTLLEGLAAEQRRIAVHVSSTGALVTAYLQHNVLDGLTPRGVDFVVPGDEPATAQTLVGLAVEASDISDAGVASLRLLVPGDAAGTASIRVLGADGQHVLRGAETVDLAAGEVTDVSLSGLPAGRYSVVVQSDVPVVAGAQTTRTGAADPGQPLVGTPQDRAWVPARHVGSPEPRVVALPARTAGVAVITALPAALDGADLFASDVPIVYAAGEDLPEDAELPDVTDPVADEWVTERRGELRLYGVDGQLLGTETIELAVGQTVAVDLSVLADGEVVAAVAVVPDSATGGPALTLDWTVAVTAAGVSGASAVIVPARPDTTGSEVLVRRSPAVGLTTD
ncbi:DUF5719 family protein [Sanguibacter sp. 25GB23B1]|uniref:DUF5719 family protein n=1 Tax=unclassified Sanguibacter TaxID=2645534 RepID=UPI0032AED8B9